MARQTRASAFQGTIGSERVRRVRSALQSSTLLVAVLTCAAAAADSLPTGGQVVRGDVTISPPAGQTLAITQRSDRAVVNWNSFSIGKDATVDFHQPSAGSAILNRVTGDTDSRIFGRLTANGQVHLVNPNGIFIGPDGRIETGGGFVASTLDMVDDDFQAGRLTYRGLGSSAKVTNEGVISIGRGGYAALIGGRVDNSGTISVPLGRIGLAAGERVTLDLSGDGFLQIALPSEDDGDPEALIRNSGRLSADGGRIEIKAAVAREAARNAINLSGVAEARSVSVHNGAIVLGGGGGSVRVTGKVSTRARKQQAVITTVETSLRPRPRPSGGSIDIAGSEIVLSGATLDASGEGDGGLIRIGGDFAGAGSFPYADRVMIDGTTKISADARVFGQGGRVVLWSDHATDFDGSISARGGEEGGDGGYVEVSSLGRLSYSGLTDLRAPAGDWGTLLIDPTDILVPGTISEAAVELQLGLGNFTLDTSATTGSDAGNIEIRADIDWTAPTTFELLADNDILVAGSINGPNGTFRLDATGQIQLVSPSVIQVANLSMAADFIAVDGAGVTETGNGGGVSANTFRMNSGNWTQLGPLLSPFDATDFRMNEFSATFLRAAGGTGAAADPYVLIDVYGLQGMDSYTLLASGFALGSDIDATGTEFWDDFGEGTGGFDPIGNDSIGFSDTLDGRGQAIVGLYVDHSVYDDVAGLFDYTTGATIRDLNLTNFRVTGSFEVGALGALAIDTVVDGVTVTNALVTGYFAERMGGLIAHAIGTDIRNSSFEGNMTSEGASSATKSIGGIVGYNLDGALDGVIVNATIAANGSAPVGASITRNIGGIVGDNEGTVTQATVSGTLAVAGSGTTNAGGLIGRTNGVTGVESLSDSESAMSVTVNMAGSDAVNAGGAVGLAWGDVARVRATGAAVTGMGWSTPNLGAFVGLNDATITDSDAFGALNYTPLATGGDGGYATTGGFAGENTGTLQRTGAHGAVSVTSDYLPSYNGGHTGFNNGGTILDGYAMGNVITNTSQYENTGGFAGRTSGGSIGNVFASGAVSASGSFAQTGGLIGLNVYTDDVTFTPTTAVTQSFWDLVTSGQTPGTLLGYGTPITTADFNDTAAFITRPDVTAWDFSNVWAPGDTGFYPAIYTIDQVIFARPDPITVQYGLTGTASTTGVIAGGPLAYVFPPNGDTLDTSPVFSNLVFPGVTVGTGQFNLATTTLDSALGQAYRVVDLPAGYTITPAPLTITANDQSKTYGQAISFVGTEFSNTPLYFSDSVDSVTLTSAGAVASATVAGGPYAVSPSAAVGTGLSNYTIAFADGSLTVEPAPLRITADDQLKTYGNLFSFAGSEFSVSGLQFSDAVDSVVLASSGAAADAPVVGSPYDIVAGGASGAGLDNYNIEYAEGMMSVAPAPLTITAADRTKSFGELVTFAGTEFTVSGLAIPTDSVDSVSLSSPGADADALVSGSPYAISASGAAGSGISNYAISYVDGSLTVLDDTPDDVPREGPTLSFPLPNPDDTIQMVLGTSGSGNASGSGGGALIAGQTVLVATSPQAANAMQTLAKVDQFATTLEIAAQACSQSDADVSRYLACLSDALNDFANKLDSISTELPPGMENVARIVQDARRKIDVARAKAERRLAVATTGAERDAIRREALSEARSAIDSASTDIRKAISFVRAEDPELASVHAATITRVVAAVDSVGIELSRASGL